MVSSLPTDAQETASQSIEELAATLEASEALTRAVLDAAVDSIITISERGIIESINSATSATFGYEAEELIGKNIAVLMPTPYREEHDAYIARYLQTGTKKIIGIGREVLGRRKDGSVFPLDLSVSEVKIGGRRLFTGICRDITERKLAEEALLAERDRAQRYLDIAGVLILSIDFSGCIELINKKGLEVLGRREHEVLGRPVSEIFHRDDTAFMEGRFEMVRSGSVQPYCESRIITAGGEVRYIAWDCSVLPRSGDLQGILVSGSDITERVMAEHSLREARDELEQRVVERTSELSAANEILRDEIAEHRRTERLLQASLKEKEVLLKEIHHRVKNNLQLITSLLNLQVRTARELSTDELVREIRGRIQSIALLHEMLYQSGDLVHLDLGAYAATLAQNLLRYFGRGSQVRLELDAEPVNIVLDTSIYCGLLMNELITNALKHAFPHEREGRLRISVRREEEGMIRLEVADDGIGLPPGFDISSTVSLGLELVQQLTAKIRGRLSISGEPGTTFVITFKEEV